MRGDSEDHFLFDTVILGLLTIFKNCQALSPFEAVNSTWPLELWQEPGVYSRVTAGMSIQNSSLFIEVRNLSRYEGQLRNVN